MIMYVVCVQTVVIECLFKVPYICGDLRYYYSPFHQSVCSEFVLTVPTHCLSPSALMCILRVLVRMFVFWKIHCVVRSYLLAIAHNIVSYL